MSFATANATTIERQSLLAQIRTAETAVRGGLHTHGLSAIARSHLERAMAHIAEAHIAINESETQARTVQQLVSDLNRIQQITDEVKRRKAKSQHT